MRAFTFCLFNKLFKQKLQSHISAYTMFDNSFRLLDIVCCFKHIMYQVISRRFSEPYHVFMGEHTSSISLTTMCSYLLSGITMKSLPFLTYNMPELIGLEKKNNNQKRKIICSCTLACEITSVHIASLTQERKLQYIKFGMIYM